MKHFIIVQTIFLICPIQLFCSSPNRQLSDSIILQSLIQSDDESEQSSSEKDDSQARWHKNLKILKKDFTCLIKTSKPDVQNFKNLCLKAHDHANDIVAVLACNQLVYDKRYELELDKFNRMLDKMNRFAGQNTFPSFLIPFKIVDDRGYMSDDEAGF